MFLYNGKCVFGCLFLNFVGYKYNIFCNVYQAVLKFPKFPSCII